MERLVCYQLAEYEQCIVMAFLSYHIHQTGRIFPFFEVQTDLHEIIST
jgi:hypothetical protein